MEDMLIKQVDFNPRNSLTLGTAANKLGNVRIDILNMTGNATGADGADRATSVNLAAGKVLSIGQFNIAGNGVSRMDGTNADLEIGEMNIANSTSGAYTVTAGKTITIGTLNKTAGAGHRFGADTSYLTGTFSITDLNTSAGTLNFYTSDATSIGTLTSGGSGTATNFYSNASIGTLNFDGTSSGVSNAVGKTLSVGSINVLKGTANLNGSMAVAGVITLSQATMLNLSGSFDGSTVSTQGLVAESSNQNTHATSSKNTTLVLNGDGHYTFRGRLHDFEAAATPVAGQKEISVVKDGEGAQYLRGETYYRGDTLVNSGELYINADGSGNTAGLGVGKVFLNGGALGATGQDSEIGTLKMTQLTWAAGAVLNFDIGTGGYDKIIVSGDILRATQSLEGFMLFSAGDYAINITLLEGAIFDESAPYELISWTGNNEIDGEEITVNFTNSDEYKGKIVFDEYGMKLQISAAPIPEPSEIAALFGACSLLFAFYRRKREGK